MFSLHPQPRLPFPLSMLQYYSNHPFHLPSLRLFPLFPLFPLSPLSPLSPFPSPPLLLPLSMLLYYSNHHLRLFPPSPSFLSPPSPFRLPPRSLPLHLLPSSLIPFFLFTFYNLIKKEKKEEEEELVEMWKNSVYIRKKCTLRKLSFHTVKA